MTYREARETSNLAPGDMTAIDLTRCSSRPYGHDAQADADATAIEVDRSATQPPDMTVSIEMSAPAGRGHLEKLN